MYGSLKKRESVKGKGRKRGMGTADKSEKQFMA